MTAVEPPPADAADRWLFLRAVRATGLLRDQQLDDFLALHPAADVAQLKRLLVRADLLTPYQVKRLDARDGAGLVVGQYHLRSELGRGGFGVVYLARHALMGRTVALKVLGEPWASDPAGREYFLREVAGGTRLNHPNVALPYDAGEVNGQLYLAIEHVDGPTLDSYVTARGPLDPAALTAVLRQTAAALQHAGERGVVHRDLKPANILLAADGVPFTVKVIDFGLARFHVPDAPPVGTIVCEAGSVVGTPSYMAPEQVTDVHSVDGRTDLYALGCTAYYAATGRVPFAGRTTHVIIQAVLAGDCVPLPQLRPDLPADLAGVISRLMALDPADRFQTPADLLAALDWLAAPAADPLPAPGIGPPGDSRVSLFADPPSAAVPAPDSDHPTAVEPPADTEPGEELGPWWREWHGLVGRLADGQPLGLTDAEYRVVHRTLLRAIRGAAPEHRGRLTAAVEPWVSLKSLMALDRRTLADVRAECRKLDAALTPARRRWWRT